MRIEEAAESHRDGKGTPCATFRTLPILGYGFMPCSAPKQSKYVTAFTVLSVTLSGLAHTHMSAFQSATQYTFLPLRFVKH